MNTNAFPRKGSRVLVTHLQGPQGGRVTAVTHNAPYQVTVALEDGTVDCFPLRQAERVGYAVAQYDLGEGGPTEGLRPWTKVYPSLGDAVLEIRTDLAEFAGDDPEGARECFKRYDLDGDTGDIERAGLAGHTGLREWEFCDGQDYLYRVWEVVLP